MGMIQAGLEHNIRMLEAMSDRQAVRYPAGSRAKQAAVQAAQVQDGLEEYWHVAGKAERDKGKFLAAMQARDGLTAFQWFLVGVAAVAVCEGMVAWMMM